MIIHKILTKLVENHLFYYYFRSLRIWDRSKTNIYHILVAENSPYVCTSQRGRKASKGSHF